MKPELEKVLQQQPRAAVLSFDPDQERSVLFDFTEENPDLQDIDPADTERFSEYVFGTLRKAGSRIGLGGYRENRTIYRHSELFSEGKVRSYHLGLDLWVEADTPVLAPYDGEVHSFQDNRGLADYGPTIILAHTIERVRFYTLYGHLTRDSLEGLATGERVSAGDIIARVGDSTVNGQWPPHLHFEVIKDLGGRSGDFPGVCAPEDAEHYLENCPDPNLVLKLRTLGWPE